MTTWHDFYKLEGTDKKFSFVKCAMQGEILEYELCIDDPSLKNLYPSDNEYDESENYFFVAIEGPYPIFRYVSKSVGGAISFRGKGRWSGSGTGLGIDFDTPMADVCVNRAAGFAMSQNMVEKMITKYFPQVKSFTFSKFGRIEVPASAIEKA